MQHPPPCEEETLPAANLKLRAEGMVPVWQEGRRVNKTGGGKGGGRVGRERAPGAFTLYFHAPFCDWHYQVSGEIQGPADLVKREVVRTLLDGVWENHCQKKSGKVVGFTNGIFQA